MAAGSEFLEGEGIRPGAVIPCVVKSVERSPTVTRVGVSSPRHPWIDFQEEYDVDEVCPEEGDRGNLVIGACPACETLLWDFLPESVSFVLSEIVFAPCPGCGSARPAASEGGAL